MHFAMQAHAKHKGIVRLESEHFAETVDRRNMLALPLERESHIKMRLGIALIIGKRCLVTSNCGIRSAHAFEHIPQADICIYVVRPECESLLETSCCLIRLPLTLKHNSQIKMCPGKIRC